MDRAIAGDDAAARQLRIVSSGGESDSEALFRVVWRSMFLDMRPVVDMVFDWNDRVDAAVLLDPPERTVALSAMRDEGMLTKLQAAEAQAKQGMLAQLDSRRLTYRIAQWGQWIALALSLLCLVLAFWIPDRTIRRIAAEQTDYDVAMKEYRAAMAAVGRPLPDDRPEPDLVVQPPA